MALFHHSKTMQINPWLIHVNVWQKPLQYCNVISLQRIKINEKKKKKPREETHGAESRKVPHTELPVISFSTFMDSVNFPINDV